MLDIRQRIKNFLNLSDRLIPAAEEFVVNKNLETVIEKYRIKSVEDERILDGIIFILQKNSKYNQDKINMEQAVHFVLNCNVPIEKASQICKVNVFVLKKQIKQYKVLLSTIQSSEKLEYKYDKIIYTLRYHLNVTYIVENSYLEQLHKWRETSQSFCTCRICALEYLYKYITNTIDRYKIAYKYFKNKCQILIKEWLFEFIIRHNKNISEFSSNCVIDSNTVGMINKHILLLKTYFNKKKISETNTSSFHLQRELNSLQTSSVSIISC